MASTAGAAPAPPPTTSAPAVSAALLARVDELEKYGMPPLVPVTSILGVVDGFETLNRPVLVETEVTVPEPPPPDGVPHVRVPDAEMSDTYWPALHAVGSAGRFAVIVIPAVPSKFTPLIARAVCRAVAVAALTLIELGRDSVIAPVDAEAVICDAVPVIEVGSAVHDSAAPDALTPVGNWPAAQLGPFAASAVAVATLPAGTT